MSLKSGADSPVCPFPFIQERLPMLLLFTKMPKPLFFVDYSKEYKIFKNLVDYVLILSLN